ncbi:hypothetical protein [Lactococcus lactis]|uniref:hypothetical protein n=1 Tax=Lactococcus lactis TaxID=1358 RepID=UPI00101175CC|nr:hypothetical protein [Lactococcus lactis]RXS50785.1 hypothetical protein ES032_10325 [Lactococcus lactis]
MNDFKLPEHRQEYISNFMSENIYVAEGKNDINFSATLINLNYENGAVYNFSIYIYEIKKYELLLSGKLEDYKARKGGIGQKVELVYLLSGSDFYSLPSYIDLPIQMTVKNLNYETDKIYAAVFKLKNKDGEEISKSVTYLKGKRNG